ncbi:hypothetical protein AB6D11_19115 [Vibrio splendidus]
MDNTQLRLITESGDLINHHHPLKGLWHELQSRAIAPRQRPAMSLIKILSNIHEYLQGSRPRRPIFKAQSELDKIQKVFSDPAPAIEALTPYLMTLQECIQNRGFDGALHNGKHITAHLNTALIHAIEWTTKELDPTQWNVLVGQYALVQGNQPVNLSGVKLTLAQPLSNLSCFDLKDNADSNVSEETQSDFNQLMTHWTQSHLFRLPVEPEQYSFAELDGLITQIKTALFWTHTLRPEFYELALERFNELSALKHNVFPLNPPAVLTVGGQNGNPPLFVLDCSKPGHLSLKYTLNNADSGTDAFANAMILLDAVHYCLYHHS